MGRSCLVGDVRRPAWCCPDGSDAARADGAPRPLHVWYGDALGLSRLRHAVGDDMAYEALRRWLRQRGQPSELTVMARDFPKAFPAILQALQVLG